MSYQVLARKWRPQTFADVVGQQHVLTALANGLSLGRIHHAYLFSGTRGVGKTTIARLLAKGLNCLQGVTASPCGVCENCREIEQGRFVDLIEIDAASRTKVEDTRDLLDNIQYAPARGRFKVYLIDEVHMLSRHSFNALLKTLEEPPEHVKFLLATTDPQKLPVTILSRCLQFHLKAFDVEQIRSQLEHILQAEQINSEARALQLLARAADGSMRDALSLTDQAIALGEGHITTQSVSEMLGTLDDEQPLSILDALVRGSGADVMTLVEQSARRGSDWESLLVECLALLHRIAMLQLLPDALDEQYAGVEARLRGLAKEMPPADVQLFYQILLVGRKELPYAPDKRMGVEMALLRALAFHPRAEVNSHVAHVSPVPQVIAPEVPVAPVVARTPSQPAVAQTVQPAAQPVLDAPGQAPAPLSDLTAQLLQARNQVLGQQEKNTAKKDKPAVLGNKVPPANTSLERLASVTERMQQQTASVKAPAGEVKKEAYRWKAQSPQIVSEQPVTTPKALRAALEYEKSPELAAKLAEEAMANDEWSAEIAQLKIPRLVQQLALNAVREREGGKVRLRLRSAQHHLNTASAQQALTQALSTLYQTEVELSVVSDDNLAVRTPLEWRQAIYEEKLAQARQSILSDKNIQTLLSVFDAQLDEESIRPI
jgi:DNA polymerase-3 subunit gamma/tau